MTGSKALEMPRQRTDRRDSSPKPTQTIHSLILRLLVYGAAIFTFAVLAFLIGYILVKGIPYLTPDLFSWTYNSTNCSMLPSIITTVEMTLLSLLIAIPISVFTAVYLVEYAKKGNKLVGLMRLTAETLSGIPSIKFWECEGWGEIGLFLIPVVSAGLQAASMWISQKMNNQVATNADGEQDAEAAKTANQTNMTMMLMMPLMSLWIGFSMPAAISIYWIAQAVFGAVQDYFLTKHYRKVYEEEDAVRQELAAKRRAEEAEKERQRALRREQNPDGITDNVSKKKIRQQEKEAAEKAARDYEAKKNPVPESEVKKPLSGDPERPYCRGRAYDPSHYGRKRAAESDAEQTKE